MTAKRDLKKRVRARQSETGERYTTALQHVLGDRSDPAVPVLELMDISALAAELGMHGRVIMFPALADEVDARTALLRIRDLLLATEEDAKTTLFRSVLLHGKPPTVSAERPRPVREAVVMFALLYGAQRIARPDVLAESASESVRFLTRARAGIGGANESGMMLAVPVEGRHGLEPVVCMLWGLPIEPTSPWHTYVVLRSAKSMLDDVKVHGLGEKPGGER